MKRTNRRTTSAAIDAREEFTNSTGSMRGVVNPGRLERGRLNEDEHDALAKAELDGITYAVYSYGTPIAWWTRTGEYHRVVQRFSQTTSCHQGLTPRA
jgi:hypothetical protein